MLNFLWEKLVYFWSRAEFKMVWSISSFASYNPIFASAIKMWLCWANQVIFAQKKSKSVVDIDIYGKWNTHTQIDIWLNSFTLPLSSDCRSAKEDKVNCFWSLCLSATGMLILKANGLWLWLPTLQTSKKHPGYGGEGGPFALSISDPRK